MITRFTRWFNRLALHPLGLKTNGFRAPLDRSAVKRVAVNRIEAHPHLAWSDPATKPRWRTALEWSRSWLLNFAALEAILLPEADSPQT
jgi:hypothetical protein